MSTETEQRIGAARAIARDAGELALTYFRSIGDLVIEAKGKQDLVSNADTEVEIFVRNRLEELFPQDGIVGEEHDDKPSVSGYTWVIDPIDGTANFVTGIPSWCVAIACVRGDETLIGVVFEPSHNEMFWAARDAGAFLNESSISISDTDGLHNGSTGIGMNGRTDAIFVTRLIEMLMARGGVFYRNASGALMLSYVAAGRLIAYAEPHMNAWDCLAGQLLIAEAGGRIEDQSASDMLERGGRVVAGAPTVFDELVSMADEAFRK